MFDQAIRPLSPKTHYAYNHRKVVLADIAVGKVFGRGSIRFSSLNIFFRFLLKSCVSRQRMFKSIEHRHRDVK